MTARIVPFLRPTGEEVELAWATHRAFVRAEASDPSLLRDAAHNRARDRAKAEFERLFDEWNRR